MQNIFKRRTRDGGAGSTSRRMTASAVGALAAAAVFASMAALRAAPAPRAPATYAVRIEGMRFSPAAVQVQPGDRITFTNADLVPHTVTSTGAQSFDSGVLEPGKTWQLACGAPGTLPYHCTLHPTMTGTVVVQAESTVSESGARRAR